MKKLIEIAENLDWTVSECGSELEMRKYSEAGQDFTVYIDKDDPIESLDNYIEGYDVSEEASLWLDDSGHGKNGAPYRMIDVYYDMENCLDNMEELLERWKDVD